MRLTVNALLYQQYQNALNEIIVDTTPVPWEAIVAHIKAKDIEVKNWLHVRAALQNLAGIERTRDLHKEEYIRN
jgi:hypothetical protein